MSSKKFNTLKARHLATFRQVIGDAFVFTDGDTLEDYSHDYTEDLRFCPDVVLKPGNAQEISAILGLCQQEGIAVTPAGARTGLSGGMLPVYGGVILATDRLNKVLDIDTRNFQVTTQPAVVVQTLQDLVAEQGLFYPVDPASRGSCFIGGNLAEGAGGLRAVKYGITKDYVLDLEVVLPTGEIIRTGARTIKNSTGYNLTQLMVGSEGTLGIITEATLKLVSMPKTRMVMLAPFASAEMACEAVSAIFHAGILPSVLEFMEKEAIDFAQDFLGAYPFDTKGIEAHLLIEADGPNPETVMQECEAIYGVLEGFDCGEILFAESSEEQERLWKVRRSIGEATRAGHVVKEEDTVVPRAELAKLVKHIRAVSHKFSIPAFCFGHAGDGNLHVHLPKPKGDAEVQHWEANINAAVREIFTGTVALGGTLSGEHGIGWVQKDYMDIAFSKVVLR
ncbi:MAG TPA: FAD-binding protein, partial [Bacteroidetes bacterium]|nr:FAD-binding protein [Bacteroidota bacterium]